MASRSESPRFGEHVVSTDERSLVHASGSIQPHGVLLVCEDVQLQILQRSANCATVLGEDLLGASLGQLGADFELQLRGLLTGDHLDAPQPLRVTLELKSGPCSATALVHRPPTGGVIVELEDIEPGIHRRASPRLPSRLAQVVTELSAAHSIPALADVVVRAMRDLTGYDRVTVCQFDEEGHGVIIAEAKDARMESVLHRHSPATDILPIARALSLCNRVRLLAEVGNAPVPIEPRLNPLSGQELDLSMSVLHAGSPRHVQVLHGMGVESALVASLVHDGTLWGLIACHHARPRHVPHDLRAACELVADVVSTRISALEHFAEAQAEVLVRRLERRLIQATETDGDWRGALFDAPRQLLAPVGATGAALLVDGEVRTTGDVPSTSDLRGLFAYLDRPWEGPVFACKSIARLAPPLRSLTPVAAGVLAIRLGSLPGEYLVWFRKEQLQDVTWGGAAHRAARSGEHADAPLPPSRAAWHEVLHETAIPWTRRECAIAKAIGSSLGDIILQIRAVRVLIAEAQLARLRRAVLEANDPVVVADEDGTILLSNAAFGHLLHGPFKAIETLDDLAARFDDPGRVLALFERLRVDRQPWRGELAMVRPGGGPPIPVALRADPIPATHGGLFGFIAILTDLTARREADAARAHLQGAVHAALRRREPDARTASHPDVEALVSALWANAGVAVSEISDAADVAAIAPLLQEVEATTRRAVRISAILGRYAVEDEESATS